MTKLLATALAAVVVAGQSQAFNIWVYWDPNSPGNYTYGTYTVNYNGSHLVTGGLLGVNLGLSAAQAQSKTNPWWAYCLTPDVNIGSPSNPWEAQVGNLTSLLGANANKAAWLANILFDSSVVPQQYKVPFNQDHAKIQVALWDLLGATVTGTFNSSTVWDDVAKTQITLSFGTVTYNPSTVYPYLYLDPLSDGQGQRLLQGGSGGGQNFPVPEPVTLGFAALGLAAALRKRRNR
ncbi:MAG: hypothetical protein N2109_12670 [Fimbriimonadales bacterium]|nr:hypothetical protein [Fimbriimonadales bacterium]